MNGMSVTGCVASCDANLVPKGYAKVTGLSAAKTILSVLSNASILGATVAVIFAETQAIRYRDDGTAPTATDGQPIPAGEDRFYCGDLSKLQIIEQAASAVVHISFYGQP